MRLSAVAGLIRHDDNFLALHTCGYYMKRRPQIVRRRSFKMMPGAAPRVSGAPTPEGAPGGGREARRGGGTPPRSFRSSPRLGFLRNPGAAMSQLREEGERALDASLRLTV